MKRHRNFQTLLIVGVLVMTLLRLTQAQYGGGTGEPNDPYQIWTPEHMNAIGAEPNDWDKHFTLMADIDLSAYDGNDGRPAFNIIGYRRSWEDASPFTGTFAGNGHVARNLTYRPAEQAAAGLFGFVSGSEAAIHDLGLTDPNVQISAGYAAGAMVGYLENGTVRNCSVVGGGVAARGRVSPDDVVGALVGFNHGATVENCYSRRTVVAGSVAGGLTGRNAGRIVDCYADNVISGTEIAGGLAGRQGGVRGGGPAMIVNCYSTSRVTGEQTTGGLIGYGWAAVIGSYWDIETSGQAESSGGIGKTTLEMQRADTFLGWGAGDHASVWTIDEGRDYPRLAWESQGGQPLGPLELADVLTGTGTRDHPFLIYTAEELDLIGRFPCEWSGSFRLMADVNMAACPEGRFNSIGVYDIPFAGIFDGNGLSISNLALRAKNGADAALFLFVSDPNAQIKDLRVIDGCSHVVESGRAAMLVAWLFHGTVSNCHAINNTVSGVSSAGGLIAESTYAAVTNCSSTATVTGTWHVGGLVGHNRGSVANCWATAVVGGSTWIGGLTGSNDGTIAGCFSESTVAGDCAGGLAGDNGHGPPWGTIRNSYATGAVSGSWRVAGLVGDNASGTIVNCYSTAVVTNVSLIGGLVAYDRNDGAYITGSFWDIETSGQASSAGGASLTTAKMQTANTFLEAGWDFAGETVNGEEDIWWILEGQDYPRLWWEATEE